MRNGEKLLVSKLNDNEKEELGRLLDILYSTIQEQIKIQEEDSGKGNIC
jgi:hypothetical protein